MSEKIQTTQKNETENQDNRSPLYLKTGSLALALTVGVGAGLGVSKCIENQRNNAAYEKAAHEAVQVYESLSTDDFMKVQIVDAEVGPTASFVGYGGREESATIRFEAELTPGDKIQDPLFSDVGIEAGDKQIEMVWSSESPFNVTSLGDTGSGLKQGTYQKIIYDSTEQAEKNEQGNIYKQLMNENITEPVMQSFLIPVDVDGDGETRFVIDTAIHKVGLSGIEQDSSEESASLATAFHNMKEVVSAEPTAEIVMQVKDGKITSVEIE